MNYFTGITKNILFLIGIISVFIVTLTVICYVKTLKHVE